MSPHRNTVSFYPNVIYEKLRLRVFKEVVGVGNLRCEFWLDGPRSLLLPTYLAAYMKGADVSLLWMTSCQARRAIAFTNMDVKDKNSSNHGRCMSIIYLHKWRGKVTWDYWTLFKQCTMATLTSGWFFKSVFLSHSADWRVF
jgi:hypothetical protein